MKKYNAAEELRQRKRDDEEMLRRMKSIDIAENQLRAQKVKREEEEIAEKQRTFR